MWCATHHVSLALGCPTPRDEGLIVNVQTDYIPAAEFDSLRVRLDGDSNHDHIVTTAERFSRPRYVTTYQNAPAGRRTIEVSLRRGNRILARRTVAFAFAGSYLVNVILTRSCGALECATNESCFGRICVPDTCIDGDPTLCPPPQCTSDNMCSSTVACVDPTCVAGACFDIAVDDRCPAEQYCQPGTGCVPRMPVAVDASMPIDVYVPEGLDASCIAASCPDDGNECTAPACVGGVCGVANTDDAPCSVDDGNPCTRAVCRAGACIQAAVGDGASCGGDDGNPCTSLPVCAAGRCTTPLASDGAGCGPADANECTSPPACRAGACIQAPLANGVACGPGDQESCVSGVCTLMNTPENCGAFGARCAPTRACATTPSGIHFACVAASTPECAGVGGAGAFMSRCNCFCNSDASGNHDDPPYNEVCAVSTRDGSEVCGAGVCHELPAGIEGGFNFCATR